MNENLSDWIGINAGETKQSRNMFINNHPLPECRNKKSDGIICVRCNQCGRFNVKSSRFSKNTGEV